MIAFFSFAFRQISSNAFCLILLCLITFGCLTKPKESIVEEVPQSIQTIETSPQKTSTTTRRPLLLSTDSGKSWQDAAPSLPENIQASFIVKIDKELLLASDNLGVFISSGNKAKWTAINEGLPNLKINALLVVENTIYAGVYRKGIYQWSNQENAWTSINTNLPDLKVQCLHQTDNHLLAGTDSGVFKLDPTSKTWFSTDLKAQVLSIYESHGKLIAGTSQGTALSTDKGANWRWIRQEGAVHYTLLNNTRIIELAINGDLVYSDDWGSTWRQIDYGPNGDSYVYDLVELEDRQFLSNNYGIHVSTNQGEQWELTFPTERMAFFDLLVEGSVLYGSTRAWDEFRGR
ncbi:MAG: hypothetical protein AAF598_04885 [Bacteroidota bacterium]